MSVKQQKFIHGILLDQVAREIGVKPTRCAKEAIKAMLKKAAKVDSLSEDKLSDAGRALFIEHCAMLLSTEFGIAVAYPGEEESVELDFKKLYKLIYHDNRRDDTKEEVRENRIPKD